MTSERSFIHSRVARGKYQSTTQAILLMPKPVTIGNSEHGTGCVCQRDLSASHPPRKAQELCAISGSAPSLVPCNFPPNRLFCDPETSTYLPPSTALLQRAIHLTKRHGASISQRPTQTTMTNTPCFSPRATFQ